MNGWKYRAKTLFALLKINGANNHPINYNLYDASLARGAFLTNISPNIHSAVPPHRTWLQIKKRAPAWSKVEFNQNSRTLKIWLNEIEIVISSKRTVFGLHCVWYINEGIKRILICTKKPHVYIYIWIQWLSPTIFLIHWTIFIRIHWFGYRMGHTKRICEARKAHKCTAPHSDTNQPLKISVLSRLDRHGDSKIVLANCRSFSLAWTLAYCKCAKFIYRDSC